MRFLSEINSPADLRQLRVEDLQEVADEVRQFMLETCSRIGGRHSVSRGCNISTRLMYGGGLDGYRGGHESP